MKKTNNKGFSLVELIIVIAIMAILIGVLAPQYIKYVEKSRVSADKDLIDSVYKACTTAASDPEITDAPSAGGAAVSLTSAWGKNVMETLGCSGASDWSTIEGKLKSKSKGSITISVDSNGNFTVTAGSIKVPEGN